MLELRVPLDYEQLPEMWQLRSLLSQKLTDSKATPKQIEQIALFIFHRLFVTLGYLARSTNQPGLLTKSGTDQFLDSLEPLFGDDSNPMDLLVSCGLLKQHAEGCWCDLFAATNPHLAGNYKPPHVKGNINSRLSAAHKRIVAESTFQTSLLPEEVFKKRDGKQMNETECKRCTTLIRMLDRILGIEFRKPQGFTPGMMASACAVVEAHDAEDLKEFYYWLGNNHNRAVIPKTTEEMLEKFEETFALTNS